MIAAAAIEGDADDSDRHGVLQIFGRDVLLCSPAKRNRLLDQALTYWRSRGFPYPSLCSDEIQREFQMLGRVGTSEVIHGRRIRPSTLGLRLANSFHPQIWSVPAGRHRHSPIDHFARDDTLRALLERAARFWPNRRCWNAQCVRGVLRVYGGGRVSNFRPTAAKALVAKYSSEGDAVLDFSAGYGGRLLGCLTLDRQYIGIDPAVEQIRGLYRMAHSLRALSRTRISLVQACAEDFMPRLDPRCIDLVFSSPPYFNVEKYSTADNQSFRRYGTYDLWKERFLHAVIQSTYRVLRKGGFLVLNIANTPRHAIARDIARSIEKFFCLRETMQLVMHVRPLQRSRGLAPYRWEPVFIFEKIA